MVLSVRDSKFECSAAETVSAALLYLASDLDSGQGIRVPEELMPSNASLCLEAV